MAEQLTFLSGFSVPPGKVTPPTFTLSVLIFQRWIRLVICPPRSSDVALQQGVLLPGFYLSWA